MYYVKLTDDMNLHTTHPEPVYCGDNLCRTLCFLINKTNVGEIPMDDAVVTLNYVLPNGSYNVVDLIREDELFYDCLQYTLPISADLTKVEGNIQMWLQIHNDTQIGNSGIYNLNVKEVKKYRRPRTGKEA